MSLPFNVTRHALLGVLLLLPAGFVAGPGLADTFATTPPARATLMVRRSGWTGVHAGVQLGYGEVTSPSLQSFEDEFGVVEYDLPFEGATYGVHAGYLYDIGAFVLGAGLEYDVTGMTLDFRDTFIGEDDITGTLEVESILRLNARVGYDAGAVQPYITGGVARARVVTDATDGSGTDEIEGDFYGAGISYMLSDSILIGGELLQHKFYESGDPDVEAEIKGAGFRATTASLRVSFQF